MIKKFIAMIRGINVGGNRKVPMKDLQISFEHLGCKDVKTLLNSGNVVFSYDEYDLEILKTKIEIQLQKDFGFFIDTCILNQQKLQELVSDNPFASVSVTKETRLYVTFITDLPINNSLKIPYVTPEKEFCILKVSHIAVFSFLVLSDKYNTTDAMKVLEKEFGKNVTTRNWKTVVKLASL